METLAFSDILGAWVGIFLTLFVFSFLYDDNPIYKLAEHLFLGISIGISVVEIYHAVFKPNLIDKLFFGEGVAGFQRALYVIPLALLMMLFMKVHRKYAWLARFPIAFVIAAFAGVKLTGELNARLMTQIAQSIPDLSAVWAEHGFWSWQADGAGVFSSLFLTLGLSACLIHFYFSAPQNRVVRGISRFGVIVLMLSFGASFGYTVMGRISLAIGRAQTMLGKDISPEAYVQVKPHIASLCALAFVIVFLVVWRKRQSA